MRAPPTNRIAIGYDAEGHTVLSWEAMHLAVARIVTVLLVVAAGVWATGGYALISVVKEVLADWRPVEAKWTGLAVTGLGSLLCYAPAVALAAVAFRMVFRPAPERLALHPQKLIYEPGSSMLMLQENPLLRPRRLLELILGTLKIEVHRDHFGSAQVRSFKRAYSVLIQSGKRQYKIAHSLDSRERDWLVEILGDWQNDG